MRPARAPAPSQQREPQGASTPVPEQGSEAAVQALLQASISQVQTGRIEAGLAGLRQVTERAPRQAEAWLWMGRAYEQAGDLQTAGRCYLRAARLGHSQAEQALARLQGRGRSST